MKKIILFSSFAIATLTVFSSCKKDYTCTCDAGTSYESSYAVKNQTKKKAKSICEGDAQVGVISVSGNNGCYIQ